MMVFEFIRGYLYFTRKASCMIVGVCAVIVLPIACFALAAYLLYFR